MRHRYHKPFHYKFTRPPRALLRARLDNIAIVPASMLPLKALWQKVANQLPRGGVLLCHSPKNARQTKLLERVEKVLKQQGYAVMNLPMEQGI
jgi:hypothetical protein